MVDAEQYSHNHGSENRMPYLGKRFSISERETKVGTPFGGMVFIEIADSIPSGTNIEVDIKGVVDTPYYDLGKTTAEEWKVAKDAFDYDGVVKNGSWGIIHEINHHYQRRYNNYSDEWGLGTDFTEITNNALSAASYILYTNIAASRGEEGTYDWNKVADPYSSLKQQIYEGVQYYPGVPNIGNFMFSTFAHEIGPINYVNVIKSTYEGGTFNGIYIPPYDYRLESQGGLKRDDRYDDMAYRFCVAGGRDYTWYIQNELRWPLKQETVKAIKDLGYKKTIPVQSVYA